MVAVSSRFLVGVQRIARQVDRKAQGLLHGQDSVPPWVNSLEQAYAQNWAGIPCVFVLSTGRVGTQTLASLANLSPRVEAHHEANPRLIKASFNAYMDRLEDRTRWREVVLAARDDLVFAAARRGRIFVETNNRLSYLAPILAEVFPDSRFIHLHRHPFPVIRSAVSRGFYQGHNWDFARIRPRPGEPLASNWDALDPMAKTAWYWARVNSEIRHFMDGIPQWRALDLPCQSVFQGDRETVSEFFHFLGVATPGDARIESVLNQKLNSGQQGGHDGTGAGLGAEAGREVLPLLQETAALLGYEVGGG